MSTMVLHCIAGGVLLGISAWLIFTLWIYWIRRKYSHIPSPKMSSFYFGHAPTLAKYIDPREKEIPADLFLKWAEEYGGLYVIYLLSNPIIIVSNPDDIKTLLMTSSIPKAIYTNLVCLAGQRLLGNGLVTIRDYEHWSPKRRLYDPAFTKKYLKGLITTFNECVDEFLAKLLPCADRKAQVPMRDEFAAVTLKVVSKAAFGQDFDDVKEYMNLKYAKGDGSLLYLMTHTLEGYIEMRLNPLFKYLHPFKMEGYRETARALRAIGRDCIQKRIRAIESDKRTPQDILTCILRNAKINESADMEDLVDDFVTFYAAGHETTSSLCIFAVIVLNWNPDVYERVVQEIAEVLGDRTFVTAEDLDNLVYLEQVLLETLRIYPVVPATVRYIETPLELSGYTIPHGSDLMCSSYCTHRMTKNFEDPMMFDPSRFAPERPKPSPFVYFPFSTGTRACIGKQFGLMEAKIIMSRLLQTFVVQLPEQYELELFESATLRPKDSVLCTLQCCQ